MRMYDLQVCLLLCFENCVLIFCINIYFLSVSHYIVERIKERDRLTEYCDVWPI